MGIHNNMIIMKAGPMITQVTGQFSKDRKVIQSWGHIHQRTNRYEAIFTVEPRQDAWKITQMDLVDAKRVKFETSLRGT